MTSSTIVAGLPVDDWAIRSPACLTPTFRADPVTLTDARPLPKP